MSEKPATSGATNVPPAQIPRPLPDTGGEAAPFWQALRAGRVELPRCQGCKRLVFYPRSFCPSCHGADVVWERIDARGHVYTFTVVHKPTIPYFAAEAPYVYAIVELDAGVRLPTRLVGVEPNRVRIGERVEPVFEKLTDEVTLLHFRPAAA
jgi:hypothetical protein